MAEGGRCADLVPSEGLLLSGVLSLQFQRVDGWQRRSEAAAMAMAVLRCGSNLKTEQISGSSVPSTHGEADAEDEMDCATERDRWMRSSI